MKPIPSDILAQFEAVLNKRAVPVARHADYRKWLMYYLDFKSKYTLPDSRSEHVRLFIEKLKKKNQSPEQQKQAAHAISLFFESQNAELKADTPPPVPPNPSVPLLVSPLSGKSRFNDWNCLKNTDSPEWDVLIDKLADEIKTRYYSRKTLKAYADCCRNFQNYLRSKPPEELSESDVKKYLTYLAVERNIAASTQNQPFNALLFLSRHILKAAVSSP